VTALALLILGIALLLAGGTLLVRGASEIASAFGVSPMVVGLTVVAFGTSTPELVVNIIGASSGATDIAFGNVVGSNISNLALVLGAAALLRPIDIQSQLIRREVPLLLLATGVIAVMALDGPLEGRPAMIGRSESMVLFLLFGIFVYISVLDLIRARPNDVLLAEVRSVAITGADVAGSGPGPLPWLWTLGGCGLLYVGGELTIENGMSLAENLGVPSIIVGLFVVAVGTSLPELVTSIIAALRRESDLAIGNVVGSNIFNSLAVLPASGVIAEIPVSRGGIFDLVFSLLLAAVLVPFFLLGKRRLGRVSGVLLLLSYAGYATFRIGGGI